MSPPLVVAYALAGNVLVDLVKQAPRKGFGGKERLLKGDILTLEEINAVATSALTNTYQSSTAMLSTRMSFGMKFLVGEVQWDINSTPPGLPILKTSV